MYFSREGGITHTHTPLSAALCHDVDDALVCHFLAGRYLGLACYYPVKKKHTHNHAILQMTAAHQAWCETIISLETTISLATRLTEKRVSEEEKGGQERGVNRAAVPVRLTD